MKIAIIGYGKMGKAVEKIALDRGHQICIATGNTDLSAFLKEESPDVAIEFTVPEAAINNLELLLKSKIPVVSGTTGWTDKMNEIITLCKQNKTGFLYASNFSIGVNITFEVNRLLAQLMNKYPDYNCSIEEIHHTEKKDAPSGTAISLAQQIIENSERYIDWKLDLGTNSEIPIDAKRIKDTIGTHIVSYENEIDTISIKHKAHNRTGFALGAVVAAEWIVGKSGFFTMRDVLFKRNNVKA